MQKEGKEMEETNETEKDFASVTSNLLFALKTLQLQNKKLLKYQEVSYSFHLQHHSNLKKIISGFNSITSRSELQLELSEDPQLLRGYQSVVNQELSLSSTPPLHSSNSRLGSIGIPKRVMSPPDPLNHFHEFVLFFENDVNNEQLSSQLATITSEQFQQLKEQSIHVLLPVIARWLSSEIETEQNIALAILVEASIRHPNVIRRNRTIAKALLDGVDEIATSSSQVRKPVTDEEMDNLRKFLFQCSRSS